MSPLLIRFHEGGVFLPKLGLWLDPHDPKTGQELVFVSHAHSDHTAAHREVILSEPTSRLMHARVPGERLEYKLAFGETREFPGAEAPFRITLKPAGHIFGSAMCLVEAEGTSLLYTGDFKLRKGMSAETCEPVKADILIMETTYGRPAYQFPPTPGVIQGIIRFCREALDNEETPVLLGYSLGKSQELLCGLGDAGLPIVLHGQVHKLTKIYEQFGHCFPPYEKYEASIARGKVLLCPPNVTNSAMLRGLGKTRVAVLTGWAVDPSCRFRYQAHAAFPLSDHADFPDLIELVRQVSPKKVFTLHGFAADFAQTLRDLGYDCQALSEDEQLALPLSAPSGTRARPQKGISREAPFQAEPGISNREAFIHFAETCAKIADTTKKLEKTQSLAEYLRTLPAAQLGYVTVWFTGAPFASTENKVLQLGWAIIRDSLCAVTGVDHATFGQVYLKHSDLGETAFEMLSQRDTPRNTLNDENVQELFYQLHAAKGPLGKLPLLNRALQTCTPLEAKYLVKILTGDLRIGLKEGLVEEALARAFEAPLDEVKNANLLLGHVGETAQLAQTRQLNSVTLLPFRPIKYMLASPEETAADIWKRVLEWAAPSRAAAPTAANPIMTTAELFDLQSTQEEAIKPQPIVWIEDKYDGIRAQLHKVGSRVSLFSRDLKEITSTFLEIADAARVIPEDFILDGEIVAMRGEQVLPFADLQKRLGRKEGDLFLGGEVPVRFIAFDLLWRAEESFLNQPLEHRRAAMERFLPGHGRLSQITPVRSAEDIEAAFTAARSRGNEGLVIKDPMSVYTPGRRGLAWLKLKKAYATLDCVVVGAEYGHGKRKAVLSDYTFAVRDDRSGELKTIGKAYTGLTDAEIADLTKQFLSKVIRQHGRYYEVIPDTVLEIAFDLIQPSQRHSSGLAMRFPRIVRIRTDKRVEDVDTLSRARSLVQSKS